MLLNYQRFNKMKGMCKVVEWSIRDETVHVEGMARLFRCYLDEHPEIVTDQFKAGVYQTYEWAVMFEDAVIDLAYAEGGGQGLSAPEMKQYIP
jgi:ribonucleotide reductase beta subunit family protein with ferritin-like domain